MRPSGSDEFPEKRFTDIIDLSIDIEDLQINWEGIF